MSAEKSKSLQTAGLAKPPVAAVPGLPLPDAELVRRAQRGNTNAFEELVRRYERKVYNIAYRLLGDEEEATEALQDTFLRAYRFIKKFKFKSSFYTWLYRIATNVSLSRLARRKKQDTVSLDMPLKESENILLEIPDEEHSPERAFQQKMLREKIQEAVASLPEDYRTVVVLRDLEGLSNEEVSRVLRLSVAAVKSRLHRGRLVLRQRLAEHL